MPIRIKPEHNLGLCTLYLEDIQGITELITKSFLLAGFSATDGVWEIYAEPREAFLAAIENRKSLDSFSAIGFDDFPPEEIAGELFRAGTGFAMIEKPSRKKWYIQLSFNAKEAIVKFVGEPEQQNWFEHFMIDLKKYVRPPTLGLLVLYNLTRFHLLEPVTKSTPGERYNPVCEIIIQKTPPSPFVENIKANLASNIIWFFMGVVILYLLQLLFQALGINIPLSK